jgi:hypothetical protein
MLCFYYSDTEVAMLKLQNVILCLSLAGSCFTVGCMDHDREWAKKFDGLTTNDPQLFVDWARLRLDMYEEQFLGFKQELEAANEKGLDLFGKKEKSYELTKIQSAINNNLCGKRRDIREIIFKITNRLQALQLRNVADCYGVFKLRYQPELPWEQTAIIKYIEKNPFGLENYTAFNEGREAVSALPHVENAELDKLLAQTKDILSKYYSVAHYQFIWRDKPESRTDSYEQEPKIIEVVID